MEYLVMECGPGYAVVLDSEGSFLKVPNLGYEVGQVLDHVVIFDSAFTNKARKKRVSRWLAMAACLCLFLMGGLVWQAPVGTVRMQINPDVRMSVNFFGRVVGLDGLNEDGKNLIEGYHAYGKTAEAVSYGLADHAMEMGYLGSGGKIILLVESKHSEWKMTTEEKLLSELELHFNHRIVITTISDGSGDESDDSQGTGMTDPDRDFPQKWNDGGAEYENKEFEQDAKEDMDDDREEDMEEDRKEDMEDDADEETDDDIDDDIDDEKNDDMDDDREEDTDNDADEETDVDTDDDMDDDIGEYSGDDGMEEDDKDDDDDS